MKSSDEGVSPVIGVILMVAITVILAAVIGTFVLDLAGNLEQSAQASVTFDEDTGDQNVTARAVSMQNADFVELRASTGSFNSSNDVGGANSGTANYDLESVGNSATLDYSTGGSGTITAVGYLEGSGSVLQTYEYGG